jgi:hypothetical protein
MIAFEQQRIPTSKKTKQWRVNQLDAICSRVDEFGADWYRMWQNYRLKNNQIDQEEFREYCDTLGLKKGEGHKFVEPFNKTHTIIDVLKGEEANMPWNYGVINLSPHATNEVLRDKQRTYREYVDKRLELEIEKQSSIAQILVQEAQMQMDPKQAEQQVQQLQAQYEEKLSRILSPEDINKKFSNYKSLKERTMHKLLQALAVNQNLKWIKNQTFEDALLAGVEAVEIEVDEFTQMPKVRQINPLNLFFHKSSDSPFIQNSDYVGYKEEMTISDVLDKFGDHLHDKDVDKLRTYNSKIFGYNEKFHSKGGESVGHWDNLKKYEYTYNHPLSNIPSYGTTNVLSEGLYASDRYRYKYENYCVVYTVYWISYRRVGRYTFTNEFGELEDSFVGEEFPIPHHAKKAKVKKSKMFSKQRTKHEWTDLEGKYNAVEWIWIPEVWKGVRINGDIYAYIEPYENAYQSLLNPYKTKLPIHGFIYNNRNAFSVSIMDRIKPWQKLYYVLMSKWLKLITQDKGVIKLLNILMMDKDIGYKESLAMAVDQGILPYNPLAHTQGSGVASNHRPADNLDLSNASQLAQYMQLMQFVEQQLKLSAGISDQRMAQTGRSTNVTDNQRDMAQSLNITNAVFNAHDLLWQEILQSLCETLAKTMDSKHNFIRQILSDDEIALLDLGMISMEDEYSVKIGNNNRTHRILQESRQLAHALVQNDKASFTTLLDLLTTDNLSEFREQIRGIEADIEKREQEMQQHQQEMQKKQLEEMGKEKQADRDQRLKEIELKGEYDIKKAQIQAMSWNPDKDVDRDGLPDVLEIEKFRNEVMKEEAKLQISQDKIRQEDERLQHKKEELNLKKAEANSDRALKETLKSRELLSKERIERNKSNKQS